MQMNLFTEEIRELNYKRFREKSPIIQKRLHAVYLKSVMVLSNSYIGEGPDTHRNSVDAWIRIYREEGPEGLSILRYRSPISEMEQHAEKIKLSFSDSLIQTTKEFSHKIYELTGISRGLTQVRKFIKKPGSKHLQTGHVSAKSDSAKQMEWKATVLDMAINEAEKGSCRNPAHYASIFVMSIHE